MPKYKVGDVVTIRRDIDRGRMYSMDSGISTYGVTKEMADLAGSDFVIEDATRTYYRLSGIGWFWTDGMLEGLATPAYYDADFEAASCDIISELMG